MGARSALSVRCGLGRCSGSWRLWRCLPAWRRGCTAAAGCGAAGGASHGRAAARVKQLMPPEKMGPDQSPNGSAGGSDRRLSLRSLAYHFLLPLATFQSFGSVPLAAGLKVCCLCGLRREPPCATVSPCAQGSRSGRWIGERLQRWGYGTSWLARGRRGAKAKFVFVKHGGEK